MKYLKELLVDPLSFNGGRMESQMRNDTGMNKT